MNHEDITRMAQQAEVRSSSPTGGGGFVERELAVARRLADALDARVVPRWVHSTGQTPKQSGYKKDAECEQAAACLRRQHAEIERLKTQRDALLRVLKTIKDIKQLAREMQQEWCPAAQYMMCIASGAIKAVLKATKGGGLDVCVPCPDEGVDDELCDANIVKVRSRPEGDEDDEV